MMAETRHRRFMAEINVIPLVDVVLVLLVIFMVTAPMLYRGMDINLPKSASNTIKPEARAVLSIERDQRLYLDKDPVSVIQLERKLRVLKDQSPRFRSTCAQIGTCRTASSCKSWIVSKKLELRSWAW